MPTIPHVLWPRDTTSTPYGEGAPPEGQRRPWVIPLIIGGIIVTTVLAVCAFILYNKRSEYRKAREKEPYLTRSEFAKRRNMSEADRLEEEEKQRVVMIRKSLASRSWDSADSTSSSRRVSRNSYFSEPSQSDEPDQALQHRAVADDEDDEPKHLKEDWKAWEARVQQSLDRHPAADAIPELTLPRGASRSRSRSPGRSPLLRHTPSTPPLRPQEMGRESP